MIIRKNRKFRPLVGILSISVTLLMITSCVTTEKSSMPIAIEQSVQKKVDIIGHRGAAGLLPENTLPAFKRACEIGVDAIELDMLFDCGRQNRRASRLHLETGGDPHCGW